MQVVLASRVISIADPGPTQQTNPSGSDAQFYVLKDHVSLFSNEITNPRQGPTSAAIPTSRKQSGIAWRSLTGWRRAMKINGIRDTRLPGVTHCVEAHRS
jgi:hypothetical protein